MGRRHVHSRTIDIDATASPDGGVAVEAKLCDIRRISFMGLMGGQTIKPGLIHDVELDMELDPTQTVTASEFKMHTMPFKDRAETEGMICSDIEPAFADLRGVTYKGAYTTSVLKAVGGPRGCFHGQSLAIGAGPVIEQAFERLPGHEGMSIGRHILIDSYNYGDNGVSMTGVLMDSLVPLDLSGGPIGDVLCEIDLEIALEVPGMVYSQVGASRADGGSRRTLEEAEGLKGLKMGPGIFAEARSRLTGGDGGLFELLSMMIPVTTQAAITQMRRTGKAIPGRGRSMAQIDSCHMWAADGPLDRRVQQVVKERFGKEDGHAK